MHVVVNAATSVDGKLSTREREQTTISGSDDFDRVDRIRAETDAVVVGVGTVLADDPSLTVDEPDRIEARAEEGRPAQPARVVADSRLRIPTEARVLDDAAESIVLTSEAASADRIEVVEATGATVIVAGTERVDLADAFERLDARGIDHVMVEGGGELLFSLFDAGLVDELSVFVGSLVIGGRDAPTLVDGEGFVSEFPALELRSVERIDEGVLLRYAVG